MFNSLFKPKPKPPLDEAEQLVHQAIEIAWRYKHDKGYLPSAGDLASFERLATVLWETHTTANYIARCMGQRAAGEPEGAKKWHDPKVFDYHYPP